MPSLVGFILLLRRWFLERDAIRERMRRFTFADTECFDERDRGVVCAPEGARSRTRFSNQHASFHSSNRAKCNELYA